jgi:uncharacterized protein YukE
VTTPTASDVVHDAGKAKDTWDTYTDPLGKFVDGAMGFALEPYIWPLLELLELAVGDPDQLDRHGESWKAAAAGLREQAATQRAELELVGAHWHGEAAAAYGRRVAELVDCLERAADGMARTADTLGDTATDLRSVEAMIKDVIRELVQWLLITWAAAQLFAVVTAGASEAAAAVASAAETGIAVSRATMLLARLHEALRMYQALLASLETFGTVGRFALGIGSTRVFQPVFLIRSALATVTGVDGAVGGAVAKGVGKIAVEAAADEFDDRRSGDDGDGSRLRRWVSAGVDPVADALPEVGERDGH